MKENKSVSEIVQAALEERKEEIIKNGLDGVRESVATQLQWKIGSEIESALDELFQDEEFKKVLTEEVGKVKIEFISSFANEFKKILPSVASAMANKLEEKAIKNLTEDGYSMQDLYKKLFS